MLQAQQALPDASALSDMSSQQMRQLIDQHGDSETARAMAKTQQGEDTPQQQEEVTQEKDIQQDTLEKDNGHKGSTYEQIVRGMYRNPEQMLSSLTVFGTAVFSRTHRVSSGDASSVPVPADYTIGAGDEIILTMWGRINDEQHLTVTREGYIQIPHIGQVGAAGMTFKALQQTIRSKIEHMQGVNASVTMGQLHAIYVYIMGEARSPGRYTIGALSSLTNALFAAGGLTKDASLRQVQVKRHGRTVAEVDLYDFLLSGESRENLRLMSGDVIFIPTVDRMAAIAGNVMRSAIYEFNEGDDVQDLIELAGGLTPAAWTTRIQVERLVRNEYRIVLDIATDAAADTLSSFPLHDGDIVKVYPIVEKDKNAVYLTGNVVRPGKYEFAPGMRINDVLPDHTALAYNTFTEYALIKRYAPHNRGKKLVPFDLGAAIEGAEDQNIRLAPQDSIIVFNRAYFDPQRTVTIKGTVNEPGTVQLHEDMTIRDLIITAGGLKEEASLARGELYRKNFEGEYVTTQQINFCVSCALQNDPAHNHVLKKQDMVYIRIKKGWQPEKRIVLSGEFVYPGEYVIKGDETLGAVIQRAGGFTDEAYIEGALFSRASVRQRQAQQQREYIERLRTQMATLSAQMAAKGKTEEAQSILSQQQALLSQLQRGRPDGRVVIDFSRKNEYRSFTLENGDSLHVPDAIKTVSIVGEVYNPRTFILMPRHPAQDYIDRAGGFTRQAEKNKVYIIKANGTIVSSGMTNVMRYRVGGGDAIVVPQKIEYANRFRIFMQTLDSVYKFAATAGIIITAFK
jgi:protein involved in polysaccharide export with SLBB domain